jgi:hypothetical protein
MSSLDTALRAACSRILVRHAVRVKMSSRFAGPHRADKPTLIVW